MLTEHSVGAVIFRREPFAATQGKKTEFFYLLLRYPDSKKAKKTRNRKSALRSREYLGFPKGHIEKGEKIEETAEREVREETGLADVRFLNGFQEQERYFFTKDGNKVFKIVIFLLAETKTKKIKISFEHIGFQWLSYENALGKLTFKNAKRILSKAENFLLERSQKG